MSLLTMIQGVCEDLGISSPSSVVGNTADEVKQLLRLAQREGKDLANRYAWSKMVKQNTWTIALAQSQGLLNSAVVTAGDFDYLINDTMWNRTTSEPIIGPISEVDWQSLQALAISGPAQQYRIWEGKLYLYPTPTAADTGAFEYKSTFWCETSGGTGQAAWAADSDVGRLSEDLMSLGILWRWLRRKGLDYAEEFQTYERRVADAIARDKSKRTLNLNGSSKDRIPGIIVPIGNWSV